MGRPASGEFHSRLPVLSAEGVGEYRPLLDEVVACTRPAFGPDRLIVECDDAVAPGDAPSGDGVILLDAKCGRWAVERAAELASLRFHGVVVVVGLPRAEPMAIDGWRAGAHLWETVPLSHARFAANSRARARRLVFDDPDDEVPVGVHAASCSLLVEERRVRLTPREFAIAHFLLERRGHWTSQRQIVASAFGTHHANDTSVVRVHVFSIREKLGNEFAWIIESRENFGHRIVLRRDCTPARLRLPHARYGRRH